MNCQICHVELVENQVAATKCSHRFCKVCVKNNRDGIQGFCTVCYEDNPFNLSFKKVEVSLFEPEKERFEARILSKIDDVIYLRFDYGICLGMYTRSGATCYLRDFVIQGDKIGYVPIVGNPHLNFSATSAPDRFSIAMLPEFDMWYYVSLQVSYNPEDSTIKINWKKNWLKDLIKNDSKA